MLPRGSLKKFPTRFVTLPPHNGARKPSLKPRPFKSQTPFNGAPRVYIRGATLLCRDFFHGALMHIRVYVSVGPSSTVFSGPTAPPLAPSLSLAPSLPLPPLHSQRRSKSLDSIFGEDTFFFYLGQGYVHCIK